MSKFVYTDEVNVYGSSVLDHLYYDEDADRLLVKLVNGTLAGYEAVSKDRWDAFKLAAQDWNTSTGAYWNTWVKNEYPGFSTGDIDDVVSEDAVNPVAAPAAVTDVTKAEEVRVSEDTSPFYVEDEEGNEYNVQATSLEDALARFREAVKVLGIQTQATAVAKG